MKLKVVPCIFLFFLTFYRAYAQQISQEIIDNYPASVVARVYELHSKLNLDAELQKSLAQVFYYEDSSVFAAINNKSEYMKIEDIHMQAHEVFIDLLERNGFDELYYQISTKDVYALAYTSAMAQAAIIKGDSVLERKLIDLYYKKYFEVEKFKKRLIYNSKALYPNIKAVALKYDSISFNIIKNYSQDKYFSQRISQLDSIKPLTTLEKNKLRGGFSSLSRIGEINRSYADNFNQILHQVIKDTTYYGALYNQEIKTRASINSKRRASNFRKTYNLSKTASESLKSILFEKEKKLATIHYSFPIFSSLKDSLETYTITYYDSLVDHFLYCEGVKTPNSHFFIAIRYHDRLKLSPGQIDTLMDMGFKFENLVNLKKQQNDITFKSSKVQRDQIKQVLNEDQLYDLLRLVNKELSNTYAILDWNEMKSYNLVTSDDSAKVLPLLQYYEWKKIVIKDFYSDNARIKDDLLNAHEETRPLPIRQLQAARKIGSLETKKTDQGDQPNNKEASNNPSPKQESDKKNYRGTFQW